jgi:hypothetical protein
MSATARDNINWAIAMGTGLTNEEIEALDSTDFLAKLREVFPRDTSVASKQLSLEEKIRSRTLKDWNGHSALVIANHWSWIRELIRAEDQDEGSTWDTARWESVFDTITKNLSDGLHPSTEGNKQARKSPANYLQLQMRQHKRAESLTAYGGKR